MQELTYAALYMLLGLAALMYTAHQVITHRLTYRLAYRATTWLARHRVRHPKGDTTHETQ
jgi:uncharacterized membrane protein YecN with MAPEG domain